MKLQPDLLGDGSNPSALLNGGLASTHNVRNVSVASKENFLDKADQDQLNCACSKTRLRHCQHAEYPVLVALVSAS